MAPVQSHGKQYRRLRNVLIVVVTVFLLHALVSRDLMALRGDPTKFRSMPAEDDEEVENREEIEHWDPQPDTNSNNWGGTPAKGGVEIYPLQVRACVCVCVRAKVPSWASKEKVFYYFCLHVVARWLGRYALSKQATRVPTLAVSSSVVLCPRREWGRTRAPIV